MALQTVSEYCPVTQLHMLGFLAEILSCLQVCHALWLQQMTASADAYSCLESSHFALQLEASLMKFRNDLAIGGNLSAQTNITPQTQVRNAVPCTVYTRDAQLIELRKPVISVLFTSCPVSFSQPSIDTAPVPPCRSPAGPI